MASEINITIKRGFLLNIFILAFKGAGVVLTLPIFPLLFVLGSPSRITPKFSDASKYISLGLYYSLLFPFAFIFNTFSGVVFGVYDKNRKREVSQQTANEKVNLDSSDGAIRTGTEERKVIKKEETESAFQKMYNNLWFVKREKEREEEGRKNLLVDIKNEVRHERPVTFRYTVYDEKGRKEVNTFIAFSKMEVFSYLENEGYKVYKIETNKKIDFFYGGQSGFSLRKFKNKDLIFWITQLSTYIKSGIPLTNAMRILSKQMSRDKNKKSILDSIVYNLTLGETFSTSLEKQDKVFPALFTNMMKAAEATGELEATLDDMAEYYTDVEETRKAMISAMSYPLVIMVFALGVVGFVLVYVIPQFADVYAEAGADLNAFTQFILNLSEFLQVHIFSILVFLIVFIIVNIWLYKKMKAYRYVAQRISMKLPVFGNIIVYKEMAIFAKTFSSLLKNNVFITDSINILTNITKNEIYRDIMIETIENIAKGDKISDSFKEHWAIPDVAYYMIVTGESTGELAEMMSRVGLYYQSSHKAVINTMKSFIEPALIVFLAVVVGGIVMAVILPMFGLYGEMG